MSNTSVLCCEIHDIIDETSDVVSIVSQMVKKKPT